MDKSINGMRPVEGTDPTAGHRDYEITLIRDFVDDPIDIAQLFDGTSETFDITEAVEFTTIGRLQEPQRLRVGDVLTMRVVINT